MRQVFICKAEDYFKDRPKGVENRFNSPTFDLLNTCAKFGLIEIVRDMIIVTTNLIPKRRWSKWHGNGRGIMMTYTGVYTTNSMGIVTLSTKQWPNLNIQVGGVFLILITVCWGRVKLLLSWYAGEVYSRVMIHAWKIRPLAIAPVSTVTTSW